MEHLHPGVERDSNAPVDGVQGFLSFFSLNCILYTLSFFVIVVKHNIFGILFFIILFPKYKDYHHKTARMGVLIVIWLRRGGMLTGYYSIKEWHYFHGNSPVYSCGKVTACLITVHVKNMQIVTQKMLFLNLFYDGKGFCARRLCYAKLLAGRRMDHFTNYLAEYWLNIIHFALAKNALAPPLWSHDPFWGTWQGYRTHHFANYSVGCRPNIIHFASVKNALAPPFLVTRPIPGHRTDHFTNYSARYRPNIIHFSSVKNALAPPLLVICPICLSFTCPARCWLIWCGFWGWWRSSWSAGQ